MTRPRYLRKLAAAGLFVTTALLPTACSDSMLTEVPPHIIVAENLFTDLAGFEAGLNALYAQVRRERQGQSGVNTLMNEAWMVGVDNGYSNYLSTTERIWNEWGTRNNPLAGYHYNVWLWLYQAVNQANTIIGRAEDPNVRWSAADKARVVAEARLIRAWAYRHLTYLWGDVPLNLEESSSSNIRTDWERTPKAEVLARIEQDLLFAEQNLPDLSDNPGKVVKAVAQHYLAELYLQMEQPVKAEEKASAVIDGGLYSLITARYGVRAAQPGVPFMDQFYDGNVNRNQGNTEVLWALQFEPNVPGGGGSIMRRYWVNRYYGIKGVRVAAEYGGRGIGRLATTLYGLNLYETTDDRGSHHAIRRFYLYNDPANLPAGKQLGDTIFTSFTVQRVNYNLSPATIKWDGTDPNDILSNESFGDQPYLRLGETYLLLAEAQFRQGKLAEAAATINVLRARANASPITAADVSLAFLLDERSRELMSEEHRRYTLLRTGTWFDRVKLYNPLAAPNIALRDTLLPIPQAVIDANLTRPMAQNPGY